MLTQRPAPALPQSLAAWSLILAQDVHLRIGNERPVIGKRKALTALADLFEHFEELGPAFRQVVSAGETIVAETSYRLRESRDCPNIPCAVILRSERGLISDVRYYLDRTSAAGASSA